MKLPQHLALLAPALRPALLVAHTALRPGPSNTRAMATGLLTALQQLERADNELAAALRDLGLVVDGQKTEAAEVFAIGANVELRMNGLISAYWDCQSRRSGTDAAGRDLADIARDTLVTYAHFLADLIFATADPAAAIQESNATATGNNQFVIELTCSTDVPTSLDALASWVVGRFNYDEARCRRVLQISDRPLAFRSNEASLPTTEVLAAAPTTLEKPLSFWSIFGLAGLLSLIFGHGHGDCGDCED